MNKKILATFCGIVMMGNVTPFWGDMLDKWNKIDGDYEINIMDKITDNCNLPYWNTANGCTWWTVKDNRVVFKRIEVRNKIKGDAEFVLLHEIGHAKECGLNELCADAFAKRMIDAEKSAKRFRIENKTV